MLDGVGKLLATVSLLVALTACAKELSREDPPLIDERVVRCVDANPTGADQTAMLLAESGATTDCNQDDGPCQASTPCLGTKEARECEPTQAIGGEAALCIASEAGLAPGVHGLEAAMTYDFGLRRIVWDVQNTLSERAGGTASGDGMSIDAITGRVLGEFGWTQSP